LIQELDGVHHSRTLEPRFPEAVGDLQHAPRVPGREYFGISLADVLNLLIQNAHGKLILSDVVDAGAATALIRTFEFD
jgi:hypothetical protein